MGFKNCIKISYSNSSENGVKISYLGSAIAIIHQAGVLGAALYFIYSTIYKFEAIKIIDTLTEYPLKFSSEDLSNGTFSCSWNIAGYKFRLISLI